MTRLFGVELRRIFARRVVRIIVALCALGCVVAGVVVLATSRTSAEERVFAEQQREFIIDDCMSFFGSEGSDELPPGMTAEEFCAQQAEGMEFGTSFRYVDLKDTLLGTSILLAMIGLLFGATFVGAEWASGSMGTLLTWEPRRTRVLIVKALAAFVATFILTAALQGWLALVLLPAGLLNDAMAGANSEWVTSTLGVSFRASLGAAIISVLGVALASVGRNTAAALGVVFAYFAIIESMLRGWKPHWSSWFFGDNFGVMLVGNPNEIPEVGHTVIEAGLLIAAYTAVLLLGAVALFNRRDVT
jgi:ABC-2 type transport system permease protein